MSKSKGIFLSDWPARLISELTYVPAVMSVYNRLLLWYENCVRPALGARVQERPVTAVSSVTHGFLWAHEELAKMLYPQDSSKQCWMKKTVALSSIPNACRCIFTTLRETCWKGMKWLCRPMISKRNKFCHICITPRPFQAPLSSLILAG